MIATKKHFDCAQCDIGSQLKPECQGEPFDSLRTGFNIIEQYIKKEFA